jgi:outer membrane protein assembly factor BamA
LGNLKGVGLLLASLLLLMSASLAHADDQTFVVKKIQLVGLQRISDGTVYDYLPVNIGDTMDPAHVQQAIRALYKTGFFRDVQLRSRSAPPSRTSVSPATSSSRPTTSTRA